jgi:GcrA cell cycle regulator
MGSVAWTGGRVRLLKQLWAEGKTATDIAALLRISRAAVLGKMFRLRFGAAGRGAKSSKTKSNAVLLGRRRRGRRYAEVQIEPAAPPKAGPFRTHRLRFIPET